MSDGTAAPENSSETVGGLALLWSDPETLQSLREDGYTAEADKIIESGKAEFIPVGNDCVVGEKHIKYSNDSESDKKFQEILSGCDTVILEHDALPPNPYSSVSPETRFMQIAQEHALQNGKELMVLDSLIGEDLQSRWQFYEKDGLPISKVEYAYALGIFQLRQALTNPTTFPRVLNAYINQIHIFLGNETETKAVQVKLMSELEGKVDPILFSHQQQLLLSLVFLDATAREREYQRLITKAKKEKPDRKLCVIVGQSHAEPVAKIFSEPDYLTPIDQGSVINFKTSIARIFSTLDSTKRI